MLTLQSSVRFVRVLQLSPWPQRAILRLRANIALATCLTLSPFEPPVLPSPHLIAGTSTFPAQAHSGPCQGIKLKTLTLLRGIINKTSLLSFLEASIIRPLCYEMQRLLHGNARFIQKHVSSIAHKHLTMPSHALCWHDISHLLMPLRFTVIFTFWPKPT